MKVKLLDKEYDFPHILDEDGVKGASFEEEGVKKVYEMLGCVGVIPEGGPIAWVETELQAVHYFISTLQRYLMTKSRVVWRTHPELLYDIKNKKSVVRVRARLYAE